MRRIIPVILLAMTLLAVSCRDVPINGLLDANWQLLSVVDDSTHTEWTPPRQAYMGIARHTVVLHLPGSYPYGGNMTYLPDSALLRLSFPEPFVLLPYWGFPNAPCDLTFDILQLDRKYLVLKLDGTERTYTYRRF